MSEIVWLTENYPPQRGGMSQSCDRIIRNLRDRGFTIHIIHFTQRKDAFKTLVQVNGSYTAVPIDESESHILNVTWNFLERFPKDCILICFGSYLSLIGAPVFGRWFNWPLLILIRGNDFDVSLFSPRKRGILDIAFAESSCVATVSSLKTQKIKKLFPGTDVETIPNGIDINQWQESKSEREFAINWRSRLEEDQVCMGLFGQLKSKKGGTFLLESIRNFSIRGKLHFLLVGEIEEETAVLLAEGGFSYSSHGFLDRFELLKYYLCCDIIAIPSFYDGMPNVLLEAGNLGIPVLAADTDGMSDVIEDGISGYLFPVGSSEDCRKKIYELLEEGTEKRKIRGNNLKIRIQNEFNDTLETERYEKLLLALSHDRSTPAPRM